MAAGATASGAYSLSTANEATPAPDTVLAADGTLIEGASITGSADGVQIVAVQPVASSAVHAEEISKAAAFAQAFLPVTRAAEADLILLSGEAGLPDLRAARAATPTRPVPSA